MTVIKYSRAQLRQFRQEFDKKMQEFELETYIFDVPHKLAERTADIILSLLEERSRVSKTREEWPLSRFPVTVGVKPLKIQLFARQCYINGRKCSDDNARAALAADELLRIEAYFERKR